MGDMVCKQAYLRKKQVQLLRMLAQANGLSESELIRRAIDDAFSEAVASNSSDPSALEQILALIDNLESGRPNS